MAGLTPAPPDARVLVIVPTHDHASTLDLSIRSALEQSVTDLAVVVIGDGVGDDTREVVRRLQRADERVAFVDRPKSASRAEETRHDVIAASRAELVTYVGDDDLLLPDHVETMQDLLVDHDFAHPFPAVIDRDGHVLVGFPTDLRDARWVAWHLHPRQNTIGLTGAAHTTTAYRRLEQGWRAPPPGRWSDHFMWEQLLAAPDVRAATSRRATTIRLPTVDRRDLDAPARRRDLEVWWNRMHEPDFAPWWDRAVDDAVRRRATDLFMDHWHLWHRVEALEEARARLSAEVATAAVDLELIRATRTWRLHERLGVNPVLRRLLARRPPRHRRS